MLRIHLSLRRRCAPGALALLPRPGDAVARPECCAFTSVVLFGLWFEYSRATKKPALVRGFCSFGGPYWTRTSDLFDVNETL